MGLAAVLTMLAAAPGGSVHALYAAHATAQATADAAALPGAVQPGRSLGESDGEDKKRGRAPSCGGCARREGVLTQTMRLQSYGRIFTALGPVTSALLAGGLALGIGLAATYWLSRDVIMTLVYVILYLVASPTAILVNKILMKDYGFGYPVLVSALGQSMTAVCAYVAVRFFGVSIENGRRVEGSSMLLLGGMSALALVLGQYPYLYLTVAFIQMLKAFSPAYMVIFLYCLGVEYPSRSVIFCVLGLSICTCIASAGEVHFNLIGVLFMAAASCSDALRLVVAQRVCMRRQAPSKTSAPPVAPCPSRACVRVCSPRSCSETSR